ncbi:hypothetical protein PI95_018410 [Hassallia byssoidea VB512170]|uniref:Uncharacterized protein n=1 Tax=Hassallia byssoidea VB512170 TaxID=1304833 RepID=A0A846HC36_9CYAN|nr:hypothetical protein [Hassalia byssoidea]NEU74478.1 hypothetical protein [Hassalia byssoidea VB512170]
MEFACEQPEKLARHNGFNLALANNVKMVITGMRSQSDSVRVSHFQIQANMVAEVRGL